MAIAVAIARHDVGALAIEFKRLRPALDDPLQLAGLRMDRASHRVTSGDRDVELGPTEYRMLEFFMQNPERVYSRAQLLDRVWGGNVYIEERTIDVHIRRLRKALEEEPLVLQSLQIENIDFSKEYIRSVEQRMEAEVEVQRLRQRVDEQPRVQVRRGAGGKADHQFQRPLRPRRGGLRRARRWCGPTCRSTSATSATRSPCRAGPPASPRAP